MDLQLNIAQSTLQMDPADRPDASVESVASWLREKSKLFKQLNYSILTDVVRNCSFQTFPGDYVLIRQGERGDCFYITLRGRVGVYICTDLEPGKLAGIAEEAENKEKQLSTKGNNINDSINNSKKKEEKLDRTLFGKHIVDLGVGSSFGELALINDDCIRNASVITDEPSDFICIDRALYNRSLKDFQARDFEERKTFIENHPLFGQWPPRLKRQVAMSLERSTHDFESIISKQGNQVNTVYFIMRGTARLVYNSATLNTALGGHIPRPSFHYDSGSGKGLAVEPSGNNISKLASSSANQLVEVCSLTNGEVIGDLEMLYPLDCYLFTAISAAPTEILSLSQKNMSRFIESKAVTKLMVDLLTQAYRRFAERVEKNVKCQTLTAIFNTLRQIVDVAESKRAVTQQKRAQYQTKQAGNNNNYYYSSNSNKPLTPNNSGMRQNRANSLGLRVGLVVTPASDGFRRFIRKEVDDNSMQHQRTQTISGETERNNNNNKHSNDPFISNPYLASLAKKVQEF